MTEHQNAAILRKGYEAFIAGDMETVAELYDPDVIWHSAGKNLISGDHKGKEAVFEFFRQLGVLTDGTFEVGVHDILASDEHGVCLEVDTATRKGKEITWQGVSIYHFKEGRIIEAWNQPFDQIEYDEFWS